MLPVKINASDYGLEENKAKQISEMFKPMLSSMEGLETEYNEIIKMELNPETCEAAHELRMKYVAIRSATAKIHKDLKAFYLQGGRFVDGWKNAQVMASQGIEENLTAIEKHYENLKIEEAAKLQQDRETMLSKFEIEVFPDNLGMMPEDIWNNYHTGIKVNYENQKAAERKAEEDRIARDKAEAAEQERIRLDNIRLEKIIKEKEKEQAKELVAQKKEIDARLKREKEERAANQLILDKERKEREALETELKAKKEAEEKAEAERVALAEAELNKGDVDMFRDLMNDLKNAATKYSFKSAKNKKMYADVGILIAKVIDHIK